MLNKYIAASLALFFFIIQESVWGITTKLVLSADTNVLDKWNKTVSEHAPYFSTARKVIKGEKFSVLVFFANYQADTDKNVEVTVDYKILKPDKSVYFESSNAIGCKRKIGRTDLVQLTKSLMEVRFDPPDPFGKYEVFIKVHDLKDGSSAEERGEIELVEFKEATYFQDVKEWGAWMSRYYENPSPEMAVDGYLFFCNRPELHKDNSIAPTMSFFISVFDENPFLAQYLKERFNNQSDHAKKGIIYLLKYLKQDSRSFLDALSGKEKEYYLKLPPKVPSAEDEITDETNLDIQWSVFFATGRYEPIRKLVGALELAKYSGAADGYKSSSKTEQDKQNAYKDVMFQAARWSLLSNCKQHPLVGAYCMHILQNETLSNHEKVWLMAIMAKVYPDKMKLNK